MPEYINFTSKYKLIQIQNFLTGARIKQIFSELDTLTFKDDRDKIKALLAELSAGEDEAAMSKVFNRTTRFPDDIVYYPLSEPIRLKITSQLHYAVEFRPLPGNLAKSNIAAAQTDEFQFLKALNLYSDMLFQLKTLFYTMGTLGGYDRLKFEARFGLVWKD